MEDSKNKNHKPSEVKTHFNFFFEKVSQNIMKTINH